MLPNPTLKAIMTQSTFTHLVKNKSILVKQNFYHLEMFSNT